jgi:hypothetical protein
MCLKIRCDGKSKKFYKIFWELNRPRVLFRFPLQRWLPPSQSTTGNLLWLLQPAGQRGQRESPSAIALSARVPVPDLRWCARHCGEFMDVRRANWGVMSCIEPETVVTLPVGGGEREPTVVASVGADC